MATNNGRAHASGDDIFFPMRPLFTWSPENDPKELHDIFSYYIEQSPSLYRVASQHLSQLRREARERDDAVIQPTAQSYGQYINESMTAASYSMHNYVRHRPSVILPVPYKHYYEALCNHPAAFPPVKAYLDGLEILQPPQFVGGECIICSRINVDEYHPQREDVVRLPCHPNHTFHFDCVRPWLRGNPTCPCCRELVTTFRAPRTLFERFLMRIEALVPDGNSSWSFNGWSPT